VIHNEDCGRQILISFELRLSRLFLRLVTIIADLTLNYYYFCFRFRCRSCASQSHIKYHMLGIVTKE
jgi:hypothetical protein